MFMGIDLPVTGKNSFIWTDMRRMNGNGQSFASMR